MKHCPMESAHLGFTKPTALPSKRLPVHLAPQRTPPVYPYASAWNKSKTVAQAVERRRPEKAAAMAEELEKEVEKEGFWEWKEMDSCRECDDGGGGMVELMECLEREAIMGEDEGKDPIDYNRRAHIFAKSSVLFQALRQPQTNTKLIFTD